MSKQYIQPPELLSSERLGFTQVVASPPGRLISVSGQTAMDRELKVVGGADLAAQAKQALANLGHALRAAGAAPSDVTSLRIYVVGYKPEYARVLGRPLLDFFEGGPPCAQTLLGIQALALPELLIEIEATAVVEA
jgi:enamine deaminase RidA (YjgF/YER057c/UK114 family)